MNNISREQIVWDKLPSLQIDPPTEKPEIPMICYAQRIERLRESMHREHIDRMLIYADREHYFNFRYFMGFDPRFEEALLSIDQRKCAVLLGNECFSLHKLAPVPITALHCPELSLPNQPMWRQPLSLIELLAQIGLHAGENVGLVGWKMFTDAAGNVRRDKICVPAFITDAVKTLVADGEVFNASDILVHPGYGMRTIHDVDTIAAFEYGASHASQAIKRQLAHLKPGMTEMQLCNDFITNGQVLTCHPFVLAGENAGKGLINATSYIIRKGDALNMCTGLEGGLSCRHGYVANDENDVPVNCRDYMDVLVKPYYAAAASWYANMRIGVRGGDIYQMIQRQFPAETYGWMLNPGHLCSNEEFQSSPFYSDSSCEIKSGMILQMDIIPNLAGYAGVNCEDGVCIADARLREELQGKYPQIYARMMLRRRYMFEEIGLALPEEVLPMSDLAAEYRPYMLNRDMGMRVR